jgi:hypothetical protein
VAEITTKKHLLITLTQLQLSMPVLQSAADVHQVDHAVLVVTSADIAAAHQVVVLAAEAEVSSVVLVAESVEAVWVAWL